MCVCVCVLVLWYLSSQLYKYKEYVELAGGKQLYTWRNQAKMRQHFLDCAHVRYLSFLGAF